MLDIIKGKECKFFLALHLLSYFDLKMLMKDMLHSIYLCIKIDQLSKLYIHFKVYKFNNSYMIYKFSIINQHKLL